MPWVYSYGSGTPPSYTWTGTNTLNQDCSAVSIPEGAVTQLKVYAAGYSSSVLTRLAIWDAGGSVKSQSDTFTMAAGSTSAGGQYWYTANCSATLVNGTYWVGLYRNPSGGHISGTTSTSGGTQYRRTNTSGFPSIWGMESYETNSKGLYVGVFYITKPTNITNASVTRNSDTSHTINWTNNSSTDAPYDGIWIDRWDNVSNSWYNITTVGGTTTSFTDTTTTSNRQYRYRVLAYNSAGNTGSHTYTSYIDTTPAAPTNVTATRVSSTVVISFDNTATNETSLTLQRREYTTSWGSYSTIATLSADSTQYTDTSPVPVGQYQIRSNNSTLSSSYVASNEVVSITAPNPPTGLLPNYSFDKANIQRFSWTHNAVDGTAQTKFSLQYRVSGGSFPGTPQYNGTVSSNNYVDISANTFTNGTSYEWQVKTWGQHADASSWSAITSFTPYATPSVTITSPSSVSNYTTSSLTVNWNYTQSNSLNQIQYIVQLLDANDNLLESINQPCSVANGGNSSVNFTYVLSNNTDYKVTVIVQSSSNQWSVLKDVEFTTVYATPSVPTFTATFDLEKAATNINITNPSPSGSEVEALYNNIYRKVDNGQYELILSNIPVNTTVIDYMPNLRATNYYYVEAVSGTPTTALSSEYGLVVNVIGLFVFNNSDNYSVLKGDASFSEKIIVDQVLRQFEGRTYPVKYQGSARQYMIDFSCDLPITEYDNLILILDSSNTMYYRDFLGRQFECAVSDIRISKKDNLAYQFDCIISRVEGG